MDLRSVKKTIRNPKNPKGHERTSYTPGPGGKTVHQRTFTLTLLLAEFYVFIVGWNAPGQASFLCLVQ